VVAHPPGGSRKGSEEMAQLEVVDLGFDPSYKPTFDVREAGDHLSSVEVIAPPPVLHRVWTESDAREVLESIEADR